MLEAFRQLWQKLQNKYPILSLRFCLMALIACLVSINLPFAAKALDLRDLLRIIPSAVQII